VSSDNHEVGSREPRLCELPPPAAAPCSLAVTCARAGSERLSECRFAGMGVPTGRGTAAQVSWRRRCGKASGGGRPIRDRPGRMRRPLRRKPD
jgi:hypothetical protein